MSISKKLGIVPCWHNSCWHNKQWHHTLHISELKYALTHGTFPCFMEIDKTIGAYSLQICDYLSQIQCETKSFLLIVTHNTEGPHFLTGSDVIACFFFVGLKNRANLVLFFKPCHLQCGSWHVADSRSAYGFAYMCMHVYVRVCACACAGTCIG